ncbi:virulence RhuM family protein [Campylobacter ureolyticus]|uniref:virulence RhuM family protein n=1 Tax=Campylobacter ureolyticus TaxID=827 RepID=UPI00215B5FBF|nr:virulence RhuM family protein [Campylobacter ureolyticus]MCR8698820.1 virulence RhuM family protein [Campylobacter ureolyticus]
MIDTTKKNFIIWNDGNNNTNIQVLLDEANETLWLSQKQIAEIFGVSVPTINEHIKNILNDNELDNSTIRNFLIVQNEGKREVRREIAHCNLDMIIAVGYRVNSYKATKFRQWATKTLKEFLIKGFVLDDERLKQNNNIFNKNYFDELIERIREIRASERLFYEKIRALFALSVDYDKTSQITRDFYATVQNKLEFAVIGKTAAEIINERVDGKKPNLGLTNWNNKNGEYPLKSDIKTAKNYLSQDELKKLNLLTNMLLDYAENLANRGIVLNMSDWELRLDEFLKFNSYEVLKGRGNVSSKQALKKADNEYEKFKELKQKNYMDEVKKLKK